MNPLDVIAAAPVLFLIAFGLGLALRWVLGLFGWLVRYF